MIGCRTFGRMGNFLFQISATIGYALKHNQEFSIPNRTQDPYFNPIYLQHLVNPKYIQGQEDILLNEHGMPYQEIEWKDEWKDKQVVLNGYWQTEKYFKEYRNEILYLFNYPYEMKEGVVAVHVRRGDYLHLGMKHPYYGKDWYENAMKQFEGYRFKFYSDEINWCISQFGDRSDCEFSIGNNEEQDLIDGSCCQHSIISSSTFGWWMAWLNRNENKKVILPPKWFVDGWDGLDTRDVVPENWIRL